MSRMEEKQVSDTEQQLALQATPEDTPVPDTKVNTPPPNGGLKAWLRTFCPSRLL